MIEQGARSKRRWTQFSLRTLLTIMLVVAAFLAGRMSVQPELEMLKAAEKEAIKKREMERVAREKAVNALRRAETALRIEREQREKAAEARRRLEGEMRRREEESARRELTLR
jgi:hypothetical protein